jgi:hypothetical protein
MSQSPKAKQAPPKPVEPRSTPPSTADLMRGFEARVANQRVVYVPKSGSQKLLVVFSFLNFKAYHRLRVLRQDQRMNLLFLHDPRNNFYSSRGSDQIFRRVLQRFCTGFKPENITMYGVSMGGNGAIFHALETGANAIAINPIIDWQASVRFSDYEALTDRLRKIGKKDFVHLPSLIKSRVSRSAILCQFNRDRMGVANANAMLAASPSYGTIVYEISNAAVHVAADEVLSPKGIYDRAALLRQLRKIRIPLFHYEASRDGSDPTKERV